MKKMLRRLFLKFGKLLPSDIVWVVNDDADLGIKIGNQFFWLYKAESLVMETGKHDNGTPMHWRPVEKREFGESCRPVHLDEATSCEGGGYREGENWSVLPPAK